MSVDFRVWVWRFLRPFQLIAMTVISAAALFCAIALLARAAGYPLVGDVYVTTSTGAPVSVTVTLLAAGLAVAILLLAYMPANFRVLALENGHRSFRMRMEDVARAYWVAHAADRTGLFDTTSEFDAVRERLVFLRDHPDLGDLEPDIFEVAAQMSRTSAELASQFSDAKVQRAEAFLAERRYEAQQMERRIEAALEATRGLRRLVDDVEMEESMVQSRLQQLRGELDALLPQLDLAPTQTASPAKAEAARVLDLSKSRRKPAATSAG